MELKENSNMSDIFKTLLGIPNIENKQYLDSISDLLAILMDPYKIIKDSFYSDTHLKFEEYCNHNNISLKELRNRIKIFMNGIDNPNKRTESIVNLILYPILNFNIKNKTYQSFNIDIHSINTFYASNSELQLIKFSFNKNKLETLSFLNSGIINVYDANLNLIKLIFSDNTEMIVGE